NNHPGYRGTGGNCPDNYQSLCGHATTRLFHRLSISIRNCFIETRPSFDDSERVLARIADVAAQLSVVAKLDCHAGVYADTHLQNLGSHLFSCLLIAERLCDGALKTKCC